MTALELSLRGRLGIEDPKSKSKSKGQKAKMQKAQLHSRLREGSWRKEGADAD